MRLAPSVDRVAGSLVGQCLGDALGFVVEGYGPEDCAAYVDSFLRAGRAGQIGRAPFPFGQYTDDSQLARELLESLVDHGSLDPADYARRIAALFSEGRVVGRGRATEEAAQRIAQGVPWDRAGAPPPAAGNGSAMRAGPVGIWRFDDPQALARDAEAQGFITHQDPRCSAGAAAIACGVAIALREASLDRRAFCEEVAGVARPIHAAFAEQIAALPSWRDGDVARATEAAQALGATPDRWRGISPFVVPSVLFSLHCFLRFPDDPWRVLCAAIEVGGDVDTTAAMAGAISGARAGLQALPAALTAQLTDQGTWGLAELVALCKRAQGALAARGPT